MLNVIFKSDWSPMTCLLQNEQMLSLSEAACHYQSAFTFFLGNGSESQKYIEIIGQWSLHFSKLPLDCWKYVSVCFCCRQMFQISTFYYHTKEMWVKTKSSVKVIASFLNKRKLWKSKLDLWENLISCAMQHLSSRI